MMKLCVLVGKPPSCWTRTTSSWEGPLTSTQAIMSLTDLWALVVRAALRPGSVSKRTTSNCIWPHPGKCQLRNWRQESLDSTHSWWCKGMVGIRKAEGG